MNKFLSYTLVACTAVFTAVSCKYEEEELFDSSAADRLNEASDKYSEYLTGSSDGWAFEYFVQPETDADVYVNGVGYLMLAQFGKDKSVRVGMSNNFTSKKYDEDTSSWEIINDMGAVLSFNTYNRMLHTFSIPEPVADGIDVGKGMLGDYEFVIVDTHESGDYIILKGKKHKAYSRLTRLSPGTNFEEYIKDVQTFQNIILPNTAPNHLVATIGETQYYFIMPSKGGELGLSKIWPAGTDSTFTQEFNPLLTTRMVVGSDTTYHVRFRDPIKGSDNQSAQEFVYNAATQSLVSVDNEAFTIVGDVPASFFDEAWNQKAKFQIRPNTKASDKISDLINSLTAEYKNIKYTLQGVQIQKNNDGASVIVNFKNNKNASGKVTYDYTCSLSEGVLKLTYNGPHDTASETQYNSLSSLSSLCNVLSGSFNVASGDNALNLSTLKFSKAEDTSVAFTVVYSK